jgi:hypothetical protein
MRDFSKLLRSILHEFLNVFSTEIVMNVNFAPNRRNPAGTIGTLALSGLFLRKYTPHSKGHSAKPTRESWFLGPTSPRFCAAQRAVAFRKNCPIFQKHSHTRTALHTYKKATMASA